MNLTINGLNAAAKINLVIFVTTVSERVLSAKAVCL